MQRSLSLIIPVHNAQATLANDVARILDIIPDLTRDFEVVIVDDGSTDHTSEVVEDLAVEYPQVRMMRAPGMVSAIDYGVQTSRGEIVVVHDGMSRIMPEQIVKLWNAQNAVRTAPPVDPFFYQLSIEQGPAAIISQASLNGQNPGFQLIDTRTIQSLRNSVAAVQRIQWREKVAAANPILALADSVMHRRDPHPGIITNEKRETPQPKIVPVRRPTYLAQLKEKLQKLAWGE